MTTEENPILVPIREFIGTRQANLFQILKKNQYTGKLLLKEPKGKVWTFYLYLGRVIYSTGGDHSVRRWRRNLLACVPEFAPVFAQKIRQAIEAANPQQLAICWEYELLQIWIEQGEINREQVTQIIRAIITEIFFDITQSVQITYEVVEENKFSRQLVLIDAQQAIMEAWQVWQAWQKAKIADRSPNLAPTIKNTEALKAHTSDKTYQVLLKLLNGQNTLRDLALKTKKDLTSLTLTFMPYIQSRFIHLVEIPDLPAPNLPTPPSVVTEIPAANAPLIACIDDSRLICEAMERIITQAGYRFIGINDPLRSIAILLARKPDFIFLDLVMPNANGYEICSQLRKLSVFRQTPIVILTGNDGIIDRVRSKVAGSSGFLSKPVNPTQVVQTIKKYLQENKIASG